MVYLLGYPHLPPKLHQSKIEKNETKKKGLGRETKDQINSTKQDSYFLRHFTCINKDNYTISIHGSTPDILHHHRIQLVHFLLDNAGCVVKYHLQINAVKMDNLWGKKKRITSVEQDFNTQNFTKIDMNELHLI